MKRGMLFTLGLFVLGWAVFTAIPADAVNANGPYYATPSWDQKLPSSTRFIVLSNWNGEAVLDRETGLVWEQSPGTDTFTWFNAHFHCIDLNVGGRTGWRLPTIQELMSLVDRSVSTGPTLPSGHPFDTDCSTGGCVQSSYYWSSTTYASYTLGAWSVHFGNGGVGSFVKSNDDDYVWCVRGGQGVDPQ